MQHHKIEITADHLQRFAATSPIDAVAELMWNALDADADRVIVETQYDVLGTMSEITVRDNGIGIPFEEIVDRFKRLGDSWKRAAHYSKTKHRFLHGKDGQGRFKALSLGRVVEWESRDVDPAPQVGRRSMVLRAGSRLLTQTLTCARHLVPT